MRSMFFVILLILCLAAPLAFGQEIGASPDGATSDNSTTDESIDNSVQYKVELGDGQGAVLVFGDNNTVYLPPDPQQDKEPVQPNEVTFSEARNSFMLVCAETDIIIDGTVTRFSKLVIELSAEGWDLVWFEQGD